jgi:hypothetical protein
MTLLKIKSWKQVTADFSKEIIAPEALVTRILQPFNAKDYHNRKTTEM